MDRSVCFGKMALWVAIIVYVCDHQVKPPSRQLWYVENHRAHEVMLGCQQSVQGNSGIIIGANIMVGHSDRPLWEMVDHYAQKTPNAQQLFLALQ